MTPVILFLHFVSLMAVPVDPPNRGRREDVFEKIVKANARNAKLVQGDIMPFKNAIPCTASSCKWSKKGHFVTVPYEISSDFSVTEVNLIRTVMKTFQNLTCVRFAKKKWKDQDYLSIISGSGCWSYVGRIRGGQRLSLQRPWCLVTYIMQHELLHALGFHHEQSRSDRDDYVDIHWENIRPGAEANFYKYSTNNLGTPYDYASIMHYGKYVFSKNGQPTITAKPDPTVDFGSSFMTSNDIERVNKFFECKN